MREIKYNKISSAALKCWRINGAIFTGIVSVAVIVIYLLWFQQWFIFLLPAVIGILNIFIFPVIEYNQWKYCIDVDRVEIIHGIFFLQRTVIPINRIQHLKIVQSFIQKSFYIADINIFTAAGVQKIEALPYYDAKMIIDRLNASIITEEGCNNG